MFDRTQLSLAAKSLSDNGFPDKLSSLRTENFGVDNPTPFSVSSSLSSKACAACSNEKIVESDGSFVFGVTTPVLFMDE